jgi:hypothetical protein
MRKQYPVEKICKDYLEGKNTVELAKEYGTYNTTIRRFLLKAGITPRNVAEVLARGNSNAFDNINDRDTQYFIGLLSSDGNVSNTDNRILISLHEKDINLLQKYADFIGSYIKKYKNNRYNIYEYYVSVGNVTIANKLKNIGILPNKSKTLKLNIPITWDMLRGIIDGDGYIRLLSNRSQIEIATASKLFLNQLSEFLVINKIHHTKRYGDINILGIYKNTEVEKCFKNLYEGANIFMERKYLKFGPYIEKSILANPPKTEKDSPSNAVLARY